MTNQEAADELQYAIDLIKQNGKDWLDERDIPILEAAISALQAQDLQQTCNQLATDCVSRQAVIAEFSCCELMPDGGIDANYAIDFLKQLPSVQQEAISLEWIDKHLEWLDNCDNDFAQLAKVGIRAMVELWKKDRT